MHSLERHGQGHSGQLQNLPLAIKAAQQICGRFMAFSLQGNPHYPARPHPGQGTVQQRITGRDHHQAIGP